MTWQPLEGTVPKDTEYKPQMRPMAHRTQRWDRKDRDKQQSAGIKIKGISSRRKHGLCSTLTNLAATQMQFNATLGYPGEGPQCKTCKQDHDRESRAAACKHLRLCKACDSLVDNLHEHMITEHEG